MIYLRLIYEFMKIGLFAVGGGLATLPFLKDLAIKTGWYTIEDLMNMVAVSESTPGPIGVNMSTFVGFVRGSFLGGICATLGLVIPSIAIIIIIAIMFKKFKDSPIIEKIFFGIRPASIALIASAGYSVMKEALFNFELYSQTNAILDLFKVSSIIYGVILYIVFSKFKLHPIFYILISAVIGIIVKF